MSEKLFELASRLGFAAVPCRSCDPIIDPACANCEGEGFLWQGTHATLSRSGLLRLGETTG